jgi:hypothetical protein
MTPLSLVFLCLLLGRTQPLTTSKATTKGKKISIIKRENSKNSFYFKPWVIYIGKKIK